VADNSQFKYRLSSIQDQPAGVCDGEAMISVRQ